MHTKHNSPLDILELFPFDHLQCYLITVRSNFSETSHICKAYSDDVSCTKTIYLAFIFPYCVCLVVCPAQNRVSSIT